MMKSRLPINTEIRGRLLSKVRKTRTDFQVVSKLTVWSTALKIASASFFSLLTLLIVQRKTNDNFFIQQVIIRFNPFTFISVFFSSNHFRY